MLSYSNGWWNATANVQSYQTLQTDPQIVLAEAYRLAPQLTLNARQPDWYSTDSAVLGQFTQFTHRTQVEAQRSVLYPQIALPFVTPGWYVTPKIGVHATHYTLTHQALGTPSTINRSLPVFSVDSGMTFEKATRWLGRDYTQTLEPRLFYLNVPYRDQSAIPLFDSGLADFNFAQIFSENQFVGQDRFSDANQLTAALTSRLIDPLSGRELMRAMLGQRFYYRKPQVSLSEQDNLTSRQNRSDVLAAVSGQITA
ncbi:MAG: LPS-assembly protein LptD, partial [Pseudomonadota bacterium]